MMLKGSGVDLPKTDGVKKQQDDHVVTPRHEQENIEKT